MRGARDGIASRLPERRTLLLAGGVAALLVALVVAGGAAYFAAGMGPEADAVAAVEADPNVSVDRTPVGTTVRDGPVTASTVGLVYYPGGRVSHESYVPTAAEIVSASDRDVLVVVVDMPLNLAVLAPDRADRVRERYPEAGGWAVGGHSLGGAMACRHAAGNAEAYDALVLHAAYCDRDVSETGLDVLSVRGGADGVIDVERERASRSNLPADARVVELDGVNHAGFGAYGPQPGDGPASLSPDASREAVGNATGTWLSERVRSAALVVAG
ncbi:Alpha/beta hydrolase family protein [Halorubrum xinjiangense]|uniref:Alpha/beta hydrolase family protein n=1 Tax=Halorubrum xinjiangense TaxID=261291 RepID=A0A1G7SCW6_9EURY|nr:alpha/beta hydrolase [Halorubrum xinjiangense]SDG20868.1 Alpha/beta hydrolase family protein [Halorubrum xinjiangense]